MQVQYRLLSFRTEKPSWEFYVKNGVPGQPGYDNSPWRHTDPYFVMERANLLTTNPLRKKPPSTLHVLEVLLAKSFDQVFFFSSGS